MVMELDQLTIDEEIEIQTPKTIIKGDLSIPERVKGIIIFAHGAGSCRFSSRNRYVAEILQKAGFATLLMDLLSEDEDQLDIFTRKMRFDISLLAGRVDATTTWVLESEKVSHLPIGYFGASTGAAAALVAAVQRPETIGAIVSRGGRPDLVENILSAVKPPTLLIVGSEDTTVLEKNQQAIRKLKTEKEIIVIPGATHLFEEPSKLDEVAKYAKNWFNRYLIHDKEMSEKKSSRSHINSYSFGHMSVDDKQYDEDLIVFPDRVKSHWWRNESHVLREDDLLDVIEYKPDLLIIGTGSSGRMHIEPAAKDSLRQKGIKCIEDLTGKAARLFNKEMDKGVKVAGAFHLTC